MRPSILRVAVAVFLLIVLAGCSGTPGEPALSYTVGACDEGMTPAELAEWAGVDIAAEEGLVRIHQRVNYVCCAEIVVQMERQGNRIRLIERNEGDICRCFCGYTVEIEVSGLPGGHYEIRVWGVEYEEVHPLDLLGEGAVDL